MSRGYVYVLTNEAMPGLVKIGKTTRDVEQRVSELWQTGVPSPFVVAHSVLSPDCSDMERAAHDNFSNFRVNQGREFFRVEPSIAHQFLIDFLDEQVNSIVDLYMPDHVLVEADYAVDPSAISIISLVAGIPEPDVRCVLEEVRCDDDGFNFEQLRARLDARRSRSRAARLNRTEGSVVTLQ